MRLAVLALLLNATVGFAAQALQDPQRGANIFVQKNCSRCHATDDANSPGQKLARLHLHDSMLEFGAAMWNHGPVMIRMADSMKIDIPELTEEEAASLITFLTAYQSYLTEMNSPGDSAKGELIWKGMRCAGCHSMDANQKKAGPALGSYADVTPTRLAQAMWNHGPDMVRIMMENGVPVPRFSGTQIRDLLAYLRKNGGKGKAEVAVNPGNPGRGAVLFEQKQCAKCHAVSTRTGCGGPEFRKPIERGVSAMAGLMWNHSVGMRKEMTDLGIQSPEFKGEEMADLIAYLFLVSYYDAPGNPAKGKHIFESRKCTACHNAGDPKDPLFRKNGVSCAGVVATMWNHLPKMKSPDAAQKPSEIAPGEMKDLVAYVRGAHK